MSEDLRAGASHSTPTRGLPRGLPGAASHLGRLRQLRERPTVALFFAGVGIIAGAAVMGGIAWWCLNGYLAGDTVVYWLAGTRVNAGHELYWIGPSDPWLQDMRPYGLYSPPALVLPWLWLAQLPGISGMVLWWLGMAGCAVWAIAVVLLGTRGFAGVIVLPLMLSITLLVGVGNVDAAVLAGVVATWLLIADGRERAAGVLVAILVSVKLTPAVLLVWLVATRRWRALRWAAGTGIVLAVATAVALGPGVFRDYLGVIAGASGSGRPWAIPVAGLGLVVVLLLGRRERIAFALAVVLMPLGSPVALIQSWAMLVGAATPWVRELGTRSRRAHPA